MRAPPALVALCFAVSPAACLSATPFSGDDEEPEIDAGKETGADAALVADAGAVDAASCTSADEYPPFDDDFASGTIGWGSMGHSGVNAAAMIEVTGGTLHFTPGVDGDSKTWLQSNTLFDVTGQRFVIHVIESLSSAADLHQYFLLRDAGGGEESMALSQGNLSAVGNVSAFDPVQQAWWQMRVSQDENVYFETSPDGVTWTIYASIDPPTFDFQQARLVIGVEVSANQDAEPGELEVDDLNRPPDRCY